MFDEAEDDVEAETEDDLYDPAPWELDEPELEPEPEPEPVSAEADEPPAVPLSPPEPVVEAEPEQSLSERLAAAARGQIETAPPLVPMSAELLEQIAMNDPAEYERLKEQGHALPTLQWGPDRFR